MPTGLVYNTTDKYRLNKIFGKQERMTKQFLLYNEWTTVLWKKELFGEVDAALSACTMKWVVVENGEVSRGTGGSGGGEEVEKNSKNKKKKILSIYTVISKEV